jgi:hypothetical protein
VVSPTAAPEKQFLYSSVGDVDVPDNGYGDANNPDDFGLLSDGIHWPR